MADEVRERAPFSLPAIAENSDGWGPVGIPSELEGMPYAPYSKSDKIGRIADWNIQNPRGRQIEFYRERLYNTGIQNAMFSYYQEEDETSFQLVDNRAKQRPNLGGFKPINRNFQRGGQRGGSLQRLDRGGRQRGVRVLLGGYKGGGRGNRGGRRQQQWRDFDRPPKLGKHALEIKPEWEELDEIAFPRLANVQIEPPEAEDLLSCGYVTAYERSFDRVLTINTKPLRPTTRISHTLTSGTTSDDPKIREFADANQAKVFATDTILAALMTCARSVYTWDIIVNRVGDKLYFDKREGCPIDFLSVSETAAEPPVEDLKDPLNNPDPLSEEATKINLFFSQQVTRPDDRVNFAQPNPFVDASEEARVAPVGYRYRRFDLGDSSIIVRCEVDAVQHGGQQDSFMTIRALNEYDSRFTGVDWRQRLDAQRGAVLATEFKNNSAKLSRWTAQALLAGTDIFKLGFVSRVQPRDNTRHVILGTQVYKPGEYAAQINLNWPNAWGIVKALIEKCMALPEGTYLIVKDPAKAAIKLLKVPPEALEPEKEEDAFDQARDGGKGTLPVDDDDDL